MPDQPVPGGPVPGGPTAGSPVPGGPTAGSPVPGGRQVPFKLACDGGQFEAQCEVAKPTLG